MRDSKAKWCPDFCPVTLRPFFMWIEHPELGEVPTYGGPFDSYTLAQPSNLPDAGSIPRNEVEYECLRYDHDEGAWVEYELTAMTVISEDEFLKLSDRDALNTEEIATLRTKAAAYEIGMERWCVFSDKGTPIRFFPDQYLWEEPQYASLRKIGFTCRKVKVCEVAE